MSSDSASNIADLLHIWCDQSVNAISIANLDSTIIYANAAFKGMTGFGDAIIGKRINDLFDQAGISVIEDVVVPELERNGQWNGDLWLTRPDGSHWLGHLNASRLRDRSGNPVGFSAQYRDVTEERARERVIAALNERSEQLLRTSPLATLEANDKGEIVRWNPAAERIFGWSAEEAIGKNAISLLVPDIALEHVAAIVDALLNGNAADSRNENITKDRRRIICQWYNASLRDHSGKVVGWVSQTADITEQVQAVERLTENQRMLDTMMGNLEGMVYRCRNDKAWTMEFVSQGALNVTGYPAEALIGSEARAAQVVFGSLIHSEDQDILWEKVQQAIARHERYQLNYRLNAADGSLRYVWEQGSPVFNSNGELLALEGYIIDVTAQRVAAMEQERLQEQIIAAQEEALRELSTPIVPISDGVIAMPLIGAIDSRRAQLVIETLLEGVASRGAQTAILDITGVPVVDTQVANALLRSAQAVKLVGAQVILTGIRPEVAQTLVGLGLDLSGIITLASLQAGIAYALRMSGKRR